MLFGGAKPLGTMQNVALFQLAPVNWPSVSVRVVPESTGLLQRKPEDAMQDVPINEALLKTPREKSAAKTIDMTSIAHPYVIRYSIALWAFQCFKHLDTFLMLSLIINKKAINSFVFLHLWFKGMSQEV
ncbi:MAG: hypothetical protein ACP5MX_01845 [Candidatus Micrarchaeia archaeon]